MNANTTEDTRRRKPGEGSIEPLPSGSFRARLPLADGSRLELGTHPTYEDAEGVLAAAIQEAAAGNMLPTGGGVTLRGYGQRYMTELELGEHGRYIAMPTARSAWNNWLTKAPFIDWPVKRVTRKAVEKWLAVLSKKHPETSDSWLGQLLTLLRRIVAGAVAAEILEVNPIETVRVPKRDAPTEEAWTYLTLDEQARLFSCEKIPERFRLWLATLVGTGMRGGEAWYLHWRDVHLDGDAPHIVVRYGARTKGKLRAPKGRKIRTVPLLPIARDALTRWRQIAHEWAPRNPLDLVFPAQRGGYQKVSHWPNWGEHLTAAGITRHVRPHDLRHTAGSALVSGMWGEPWRLHEVRDFLGHASVEETERYAHLAPEALARSASRTTWSPLGPMPVPHVPDLAVITDSSSAQEINPRYSPHPEQLPAVRPSNGIAVGSDLAARLLAAAAAGEDCTELAESLASEVLACEPVRLARKVLADTPDAMTRALELARLLVQEGDQAARPVEANRA